MQCSHEGVSGSWRRPGGARPPGRVRRADRQGHGRGRRQRRAHRRGCREGAGGHPRGRDRWPARGASSGRRWPTSRPPRPRPPPPLARRASRRPPPPPQWTVVVGAAARAARSAGAPARSHPGRHHQRHAVGGPRLHRRASGSPGPLVLRRGDSAPGHPRHRTAPDRRPGVRGHPARAAARGDVRPDPEPWTPAPPAGPSTSSRRSSDGGRRRRPPLHSGAVGPGGPPPGPGAPRCRGEHAPPVLRLERMGPHARGPTLSTRLEGESTMATVRQRTGQGDRRPARPPARSRP